MGTDDAEAYLEAILLSDGERAEIVSLVDSLYESYTDFVAEMYEWVTSHDMRELGSTMFFAEKVSGELSRPLNSDELARLGTPVRMQAIA
jgi:hypothetical protein